MVSKRQEENETTVPNISESADSAIWMRIVESFGTERPATIGGRIGISHTAVTKWKKEAVTPSLEILLSIANETKVSKLWFLTGEGTKDDVALITAAQIAALKNISGNQWQETLKQIIDEGIELRMRGDHNRTAMPLAFDDYIRAIVRDEIEKKFAEPTVYKQ